MAKIPFSIDYRPQIESGKYKVQTRDGRSVRIICWDRKGDDCPIIALLNNTYQEDFYDYFDDGRTTPTLDCGSDLFIITPETELSEFEKELESFYNHHLQVCTCDNQGTVEDSLHDGASKLLALVKKELCKDCAANLEGYIKGREDARKEMEYKHEDHTIPAFWPPCHYGGVCANPFHDCINCPHLSTIGINTTTGTSTAKVEGKK